MIDYIMSLLVSAALLLIAIPSLYVATSPHYHTGIVRTLALGVLGVSSSILAVWEVNGIQPDELEKIVRVQGIMAVSFIVMAVNFFMRTSAREQLTTLHVITDAMPLDESQQAHVSGGTHARE